MSVNRALVGIHCAVQHFGDLDGTTGDEGFAHRKRRRQISQPFFATGFRFLPCSMTHNQSHFSSAKAS